MESVRKGKGLKKEWEIDMGEHDVPDWYIESCKKIQYMFPKAHAVAYVVLSLRVAWFKVYYPKEYYSARFTMKVDDFDAAGMIHGLDKVYGKMAVMGLLDSAEGGEASGGERTAKEEDQAIIYEQLVEMYARGLRFLPVDIYKSDAKRFLPEDDAIRPPLCALQGLGVTAAENIVRARERVGEFMSVEDLKISAGINKNVVETLREEGCLAGWSESNQLSLF